MVNNRGARINEVFPDSIADELGLEAGDLILAINGVELTDLIQFLHESSNEQVTLEVQKKDGEIFEIEFEKDPNEFLGLTLEDVVYDQVNTCKNHCIFCFVHQLPKGQRSTLYVQDDDYRLSFLQGCYITLTNLSEADWNRIETLHLSPLYISVHATEPTVRRRLLGCRDADQIMSQLQRLAKADITVHTQAVICPGINDGVILEQTINDLFSLWPNIASLAVVPVGLTEHRENLYQLQKFKPDEASRVLDLVHQYQQQFLDRTGTRFVFAADEWYIQAGRPIPANEDYEDYPQLDNGVGLIRWFITEFEENLPDFIQALTSLKQEYVIVTGVSTKGLWDYLITRLNQECPELRISSIHVENQFFGRTVTVTGLLSGQDLMRAIINHPGTAETLYLIPQITLKQGEDLFLDGLSLEELISGCQPKKIAVVPTRAYDWLCWFEELANNQC
ncbi:MAG TPA: DUF512 domain-containing protein [Bacillota bacterium]|jgi:putative radical SAM enzyme (TIGR03279 family)|nr:DUF512 domain-containing protein [Bacillota bacterium]HOL09835.1 DUF512 domain-containing protein [Bacillota bacterium]HPO97712.1 DUF512 domain-containing protein [Bacillota bacterium]